MPRQRRRQQKPQNLRQYGQSLLVDIRARPLRYLLVATLFLPFLLALSSLPGAIYRAASPANIRAFFEGLLHMMKMVWGMATAPAVAAFGNLRAFLGGPWWNLSYAIGITCALLAGLISRFK